MRVTRRLTSMALAVALSVALLAGCADDGPGATAATGTAPATDAASATSTSTTAAAGIDGVTAELVITRQRDLLDRGLINVLTRNDSEHDLLLGERRLDADFFDAPATDTRAISIRAGRSVAVQVPYGTAEDCDSDEPVSARFAFSYTGDGDDTPRRAVIEVGGTHILDGIRAEQCAAASFDRSTDTSLGNLAVQPDGTLTADLVIEPHGEAEQVFTVEGVSGTILIAARTPEGTLPVTVAAGPPVTIPVVFVVNRCDPHAMAEVTKRYGLDLQLAVDGAPAVRVPIDVTAIEADLEGIVGICRQRRGDG